VKASALYLPVHPHGFAYSIRIKLADDAPHETCQLKTRRWLITNADASPPEQTRRVQGEGVVGKFPRLTRGGGWRDDFQVADIQSIGFARAVRRGTERRTPTEFVYQSYSGLMTNADAPNTFAGQMDFFPGEVLEPSGPPFHVTVPTFLLKRPAFIF